MIDWLIEVNTRCRAIAIAAVDCNTALILRNEYRARVLQQQMQNYFRELDEIWKQVDRYKRHGDRLARLSYHINQMSSKACEDILKFDLPDLQERAEQIAKAHEAQEDVFELMLHDTIKNASLKQFKDGHLRDAVLNSVIAVFDMIRKRSGLAMDGQALVGQAFSLENGALTFSEIETESGKNDQKGFMQILQGVYQGVRNVKAHSLEHDLNEIKAAQYLVMMSLLARRVEECKERDNLQSHVT